MLKQVLARGYRFARAELALLAALIITAGGTLGFLEIAEAVDEGEIREFERSLMVSLREPGDLQDAWGPDWFEEAMLDFTSLGSTSVLSMLTLFTAGFLLVSGKRMGALLVPISVGGAALVMSLLKDLFARTRPDVVPHLVYYTSESFPSGHAMVSTAAYLTLAVIMAEAARRRIGAYLMTCAVLLSLVIGFSRVYLGVHWPTDVLAGWCAGAAWATGCWLLTYRIVSRDRAPNPMNEQTEAERV
jgi:undecaprenyl-diphosphatase